MVLGTARELLDPSEKAEALRAIVEHVAAGRSEDVRGPSETELKATNVLDLPIEEASAKVRTGPPLDDEEDYALGCWAGVLPLRLVAQEPTPDPRLPQDVPALAYVTAYRRP